MKRAAADAELFGCGGHVAVRRCKRLGDQFSFRLVQIEWTRFFAESLTGRNAAGQLCPGCLVARPSADRVM